MNILECSLKTEQAARLAGVKMGTMQYWVSTGLITPHKPPQGSGTRTGWAFLDIIRLRVISRLRNGGISLQKIRNALKRLGEWGEADPLGCGRLLAINGELFWIESEEHLVNILQGQRALSKVLLIDLQEVAQDTREKIRAMCAA